MIRPSFLGSLETMSDRDFHHFSAFIQERLGIKMPLQKKSMLEARLRKRLRALSLSSFTEYREFFFSPEGMERELVNLCDAVTTNKTDFFREPAHFDFLVERALPELLSHREVGISAPLRLWSAGCSTGEEPYTLAMVLSEFAQGWPGFQFSILGTDLSSQVLEKALAGIYDMDRVAPIPRTLQRKYLLRSKNKEEPLARVVPELRARVSFRRLNFMDSEYRMSESVEILFCRNVIIYFDRPTQARIVGRLCRHLLPGGFIFMGHSETLNGMGLPLQQVAPSVYRRVRE